MKRFSFPIFAIFFATCSGVVFSAEETAAPSEGTYEWYIQTTDKYCKSGEWSDAVYNPLISIDPVRYPALDDKNGDSKMRRFIDSVKGDTSAFEEESATQEKTIPLAGNIEKAGDVYAERMDAIYDCAAYNTMLRSNRDLIQNKLSAISLSPNFATEMRRKSDALEKRMKERKCRNVSEIGFDGQFSLKKLLADQSTLEYCNYRHYLYYVDYNVRNDLGKVLASNAEKIGNSAKKPYVSTTDTLARNLTNLSVRAENEMDTVRSAYRLAFEAFKEFEREYPSHVLSLAIISKLTEIRTHLDNVATPLSQLIEAGKWAQSTGR